MAMRNLQVIVEGTITDVADDDYDKLNPKKKVGIFGGGRYSEVKMTVEEYIRQGFEVGQSVAFYANVGSYRLDNGRSGFWANFEAPLTNADLGRLNEIIKRAKPATSVHAA